MTQFKIWHSKNNFLFLLAALLSFFILNSFLFSHQAGMYLSGLLFTVIIMLSVSALYRGRRFLHWLMGLALLAWLAFFLAHVFPDSCLHIIDYVLSSLFFAVVTYLVIEHVMRQPVVSANTIYGAICGYLLLGVAFAFLYGLIYNVFSVSFYLSDGRPLELIRPMQELNYYSFVTLTTVGYGDITPVLPIARTFSWMEAALGQIYLTVLIARLVSLQVAERKHQ